LAPKKKDDGESAEQDPGWQDLDDHIRLQFLRNAAAIAKHEKPERLFKMMQSCPALKPADPDHKELWRIVEKVRREVLKQNQKDADGTTKRHKKQAD
jgi:hypothetical protein